MKQFLPLLILFLLSAPISVSAEDETPWWTKGYEATQTTETNYTYGANGIPIPDKNSLEGSLEFFDIRGWELEDFSSAEQEVYHTIERMKEENAELSDENLVASLTQQFGETPEDDLLNILGLYEYVTSTGYFSYLNKKPKSEEIRLFDTRFEIYQKEHPEPPKTPIELNQIEQAVNTRLGTIFQMTPEEIQEVVYRMEMYQNKHDLPKPLKLSESLES